MDEHLITLLGNLVLALQGSNNCIREGKDSIGVNLLDSQVNDIVKRMEHRILLNELTQQSIEDYFTRVQNRAMGRYNE